MQVTLCLFRRVHYKLQSNTDLLSTDVDVYPNSWDWGKQHTCVPQAMGGGCMSFQAIVWLANRDTQKKEEEEATEGVASEQTTLLHFWETQMSADDISRTVIYKRQDKTLNWSSFVWYLLTVSGGWWRGVSSSQRGLGFGPVNRMHLVVEPIQEAVMKMLPYFVENAVLTQSEINRM